MNSFSGIKNIFWDKQYNKYRLQIGVNGKLKSYGRFDTIEDALTKRNELLPLLHKEFAKVD